MTELALDENGTMAWQHTNVYAAGSLIASYDPNGLHFLLADWLGTRRAQTDYAGVLEQTCQGLPFGNGLTCTGSASAPTEHHFTGYERDTESGLEFATARHFSSTVGRFMSPDPYLGSIDLTNPQSFNRYTYALNNPLSLVDPSGLVCIGGSSTTSYNPSDGSIGAYTDTSTPSGCTAGGGYWDQDGTTTISSGTTLATQTGNQPNGDPIYTMQTGVLNLPDLQAALLASWALPSAVSLDSGSGGGGFGGGGAPSNQNPTYKQCVSQFYNSTAGKIIDFGSIGGLIPGWSPNASRNFKELATLGAAKFIGLKGMQAAANKFDVTQIGSLFGQTVTIPSSAAAGIDVGLHFIGKAAAIGTGVATAADLIAHYACVVSANPPAPTSIYEP